jgi:glycosyltransferase involved in cell wall biosynthesis
MSPLVSICMPTYNAARWIRDAIDSALAQTWEDFELIISDNASTDSTLKIARSYSDPRIRVVPSARNVGFVLNHNRLVKLSAGSYIKFLHADDALAPTCVEQMVRLALEDERIGLVFAPRETVIYDQSGKEWARMISRKHEQFGQLDRINEGRPLFLEILFAGLAENWIGEPSTVLVARTAFERCGLFNPFMRQTMDLEAWLRVLLRYRVGFVDESLCLYRSHQQSVTAADHAVNRGWLDRLWLLEGLVDDAALGPWRTYVFHLRRKALREALVKQMRRMAKAQFTPELTTYLRFRALPAAERRLKLHEPLDPVPLPG